MKEPLACNEIAEPAVLFFMLEEDSASRIIPRFGRQFRSGLQF